MPKLTRREFLTFAGGVAAGGVLSGMLPPALRKTFAAPARSGTIKDVQHVVIFMQENRSFDHYFGTLSGVRGFSDPAAIALPNGNSVFRQPSSGNPNGYELPFHLDTKTTKAQCVADTDHSWTTQHQAWNGGKMDSWIAAKGTLAMGYYTRADIPFHYALADAFTICDGYHCSVLGPTNPNRLYLFSGMIDPTSTGGGPVVDNSESPPYTWTTYPERLQAAGISWKVYQQSDNYDDNALAWFAQYQQAPTSSPLYQKGMVKGNLSDFVNDIAAGQLPQVSYIIAPSTQSEHPTSSPAAGADLAYTYLQALASYPSVWNSTVFLYTYDENDGFFDHVVPPTPPAGTVAEFVNGQPIGLGFRVPMIVISPFSQGSWVCSQTFDHTSIIRFLEACFGVYEPNISAWRRNTCGDLTSALDFTRPNFTFPPLFSTAQDLAAANSQCQTLPAPSVPITQSMPIQEAGVRRSRLF